MFILNQTRSNSINVDIIDQIVAVPPRMGDEEKRPRVIALIGSQEETLAIYSTMEDCRTAVEYVSFLINNNGKKIVMPTQKEMLVVNKAKEIQDSKNAANISIAKLDGANLDDIIKMVVDVASKQNPGGAIK